MSLKLFRSTGYSSILAAGESRVATHPGWLVLAASLWIGFGCNVALWHVVHGTGSVGHALLAGAFIASASLAVLSLFGWRRTLKHTATLLLLLAALAASSLWVQGRSLDGGLFAQGLRNAFFPGSHGLLQWQFTTLLLSFGLVPMLWVWQLQVRRLPGGQQLACNVTGALIGVLCMAVTGWLLFGRF